MISDQEVQWLEQLGIPECAEDDQASKQEEERENWQTGKWRKSDIFVFFYCVPPEVHIRHNSRYRPSILRNINIHQTLRIVGRQAPPSTWWAVEEHSAWWIDRIYDTIPPYTLYLSGKDCSALLFLSKTCLPHGLVGWGASRGYCHCATHTTLGRKNLRLS